MKIFILFRNPFPYGMAPSQHVTCEALGLKAAGAEVEVIVFVPPLDKSKDDGLPANGVFRNIPYNYIHGKFRPAGLIGQVVNRFYNTFKTFFWGLRNFNAGDIVYSYGGDNTTLMLLTCAAHMRRAKIVVELVEIPFYGPEITNRLRRWFDTTFLFSHFDAFVCISHTLIDYAKKYAKNNAPTHLMPILVEENNQMEKNESSDQVPYIIHTGLMTERKDGISYILKAFADFKKVDKTGCRLVFTGPMADVNTCKWNSMIEELGISRYVDLMGLIESREKLLLLQHNAAMSIVYKIENIQTKYCFATKIGEILMAGIPLITTNATEHIYYLRHNESAILVKPENVQDLSEAIKYVLEHKEEASTIGKNGRNLALTEFSPTLQGQKLCDFFKTI